MTAEANWDAVVVGSGFGGAVTAAKLAERGMRVLVLERGPWWGPGGEGMAARERRFYPRGPLGISRALRGVRWARGRKPRELTFRRDGLIELHAFPGLIAVTGSGVGGGSHLYTNIMAQPESGFWDAFPDEISAGEMQPYYDAVRAMLRPTAAPELPSRTAAFAQAVTASGATPVEYPELAMVFSSRDQARPPAPVLNAAGVVQHASTYAGTDILGCEDGGKTTLDLTYIPKAMQHGARVRPLAEVTEIGRDATGYWVRWRDHKRGRDNSLESVVRTPRLILAAGTFGTLRLLMKARDNGTIPRLPSRLGLEMTHNGDMASIVYRSPLIRHGERGPSFGSFTRVRSSGQHRFLVGDIGLPLNALPLPNFVRRRLSESMILFAMGRDNGGGRVWMKGGRLLSDLGRAQDPALCADIEATMDNIAAELRGNRVLYNWPHGRGAPALTTVHTLGGAAIGEGPENGVVDHRGQVFGNPGLFVADGSLYPAAPGIPPSMTIAALAERQAALLDEHDVPR